MADYCQHCGKLIEPNKLHICTTYPSGPSIAPNPNMPCIPNIYPPILYCRYCMFAHECENAKLPDCYKKKIN